MTKVQIYTDGSARGNPDGPGGYGTVLQFLDSKGQLHEKVLSAGYQKTTNNRMELMAAIVGLEALNRPCQVELYSDSKYLTDAFNQHWIDNWVANNWKRGKSGEVKNIDLWERLLDAKAPHQVSFIWIKGHAGHPQNERCDKLATSAADGEYLLMATKRGLVKKTPIKEYAFVRKTGLAAITLREEDELIEVKYTNNDQDVFLITKYGQCIRFDEKDVRPTGRTSMGVRGMNLSDRDEVIGMQLDSQGAELLIVSERGMGKRTSIGEFTSQNRGGKGIKCYKITEKTGNVVGVKAVNDDDEVMIINTEGIVIRMRCSGISVLGRVTSGVKLIDLKEGDIVASIAKVRKGDEETELDTEEESEEV